jgi:hypothetical protein
MAGQAFLARKLQPRLVPMSSRLAAPVIAVQVR